MKRKKLPKIGSAESIKTLKQGRALTVNSLLKFDPKDFNKRIEHRSYRPVTISIVKSAAKRILRFPRSTEKQRKVATSFLEFKYLPPDHFYLHAISDEPTYEIAALILRINRTLSLSNRDY